MISLLNLVAFVAFATSLFTRSTDPIVPQIAIAFEVIPAAAALLATAFALPYAMLQPVLGALADMFSKTRLMTLCLLILVIASFIAMFAPSFEVLMAARVISGAAAGGVFPIALALTGDRVPVAQRQVAIGRLLAAAMAGNLIGASGAGFLADLFGWRSVFLAIAAIGVVVLFAAVRGFRGMSDDEAPGRFDLSSVGPNYRAIFSNPMAKYCFGAVFFEAMFILGLFPHVASLLRAGGEERASIAGIVLAGFGIGAIIYTFMVSRLLSWFSSHWLVIIGGTTMGFCLLMVALRLPWPMEFANFVLLGFGMYFLHGYIQVIVTELVPAARGSAMAVHSAFFFMGQAVGPVVYGAGFTMLGVTTTMIIASLIMVMVGIICGLRLRRST